MIVFVASDSSSRAEPQAITVGLGKWADGLRWFWDFHRGKVLCVLILGSFMVPLATASITIKNLAWISSLQSNDMLNFVTDIHL